MTSNCLLKGVVFIQLTLLSISPLIAQGEGDQEKRQFVAHPFYEFDMAPHMSAHSSLADLDQDGDLDIAVANGRHWAQQNYWFRNNGKARMLEAIPIGATMKATYQILVGTLNNDGFSDLVVINDKASVELFYGTSNGFSSTPNKSIIETGNARGAYLGDLNGDNMDDLVIARRNASNVIYWGNHQDPFKESLELGQEKGHSTSVAVADFNSDGILDIVFSSRRGEPELHIGAEDKKFTMQLTPKVTADIRGVQAADFNNDNIPDLAFAVIEGESLIFINDGHGKFKKCAALGDVESESYAIAADDLDLDGDIDVVVGNDSQPNFVYWNTGNCKFIASQLDMNLTEVYSVSTGDLNGDKYPEIVFTNSDQANSILLNRQRK